MRSAAAPATSDGLVDVVLTTKNRPAWVREALASVRAQGSVLRTCFVVDDGSSIGSTPPKSALSGWPCELIELPTSVGPSGARRAGMAASDAPYILFLDDDDRLAAGALSRLAELLDTSRDAVASVGGRLIFDDSGQAITKKYVWRVRELDVFLAAWFGWVACQGQALFRRERLAEIGGWVESYGAAAEDQQVWLRLAGLGPVTFAPDVVLENRAHDSHVRAAELESIEHSIRDALLGSLSAPQRHLAADAMLLRSAVREARRRYAGHEYVAALNLLTEVALEHPRAALHPLVRVEVVPLWGRAFAAAVLGRAGTESLRKGVRSARRWTARGPGGEAN
jgi:glycosyltransferase involved in cell wall biosynthesis